MTESSGLNKDKKTPLRKKTSKNLAKFGASRWIYHKPYKKKQQQINRLILRVTKRHDILLALVVSEVTVLK